MTAAPSPLAHERHTAEALARQAGALLMHHRTVGFTAEEKTSDEDLVTVADKEASTLIVAGLRAAFPGDGLLSEEEDDTGERLSAERQWIIDPIDGTAEYVEGTADFCVSIGLVVGGEPVLGVVYAPVHDELFSGVPDQGDVLGGVWKNGVPSGFSPRTGGEAILAVSDTEYERELKDYPLRHLKPSGSIALKLARIAAGEADATFTMSPRSDWDIAAGMALVAAAGGVVTRRDGSPILLGSAQPYLRRGLIGGRRDLLPLLAAQLRAVSLPEQVHAVTPEDADVWALLPAGLPTGTVHLRHALTPQGDVLLALEVVQGEAGNATVVHQQGQTHHLHMLRRDMVRMYGRLAEALGSGV